MYEVLLPLLNPKVHCHNKAHIDTFDIPDARFHHVHFDLVGPLSSSRGRRFLFTCGDRFSKWCETIPLVDIHTETGILTILQNWIARFGAPNSVTTNRGPQFESTLFAKLCEFLG